VDSESSGGRGKPCVRGDSASGTQPHRSRFSKAELTRIKGVNQLREDIETKQKNKREKESGSGVEKKKSVEVRAIYPYVG
jgi:hypothetical protein